MRRDCRAHKSRPGPRPRLGKSRDFPSDRARVPSGSEVLVHHRSLRSWSRSGTDRWRSCDESAPASVLGPRTTRIRRKTGVPPASNRLDTQCDSRPLRKAADRSADSGNAWPGSLSRPTAKDLSSRCEAINPRGDTRGGIGVCRFGSGPEPHSDSNSDAPGSERAASWAADAGGERRPDRSG